MTALAANKQARLAGAAGDVRAARGDAQRHQRGAVAGDRLAGRALRRPRRRWRSWSRRSRGRRPSGPRRDGTALAVTAESVSGAGRLRPGPGRGARRRPRGGDWPVIPTAAGHDAGILSAAGIPTAMLFVRNPTGVSHSPAEHAAMRRLPGRRRGARRHAGEAGQVSGVPAGARLGRRRGPRRRAGRDRGRAVHRVDWSAETPLSAGITADRRGIPGRPGIRRVPGLTIPGLANCHSHAFHRALRGRTQRERGHVLDLARADVRRRRPARPRHLLRAGPGDVPRDGRGRDHHGRRVPLPAPPAGRHAVRRPERDGPRARRGGPRGRAPASRCSTPATSAAASARRSRACRCGSATATPTPGRTGCASWTPLADRDDVRVGAAVHSVRAVPRDAAAHGRPRPPAAAAARPPLRAGRRERGLPRGVRRHPDAAARRGGPARPAHHRGARDPPDRRRRRACSASAGTYACFCPTTERDLGDGIGPGRAAARRRAPGSRSAPTATPSIDLFEEMRGGGARRAAGHPAARALDRRRAAGRGDRTGTRAWASTDAGAIAVGQRADLVTLDTATPRTAGTGADEHTAVFAASGRGRHPGAWSTAGSSYVRVSGERDRSRAGRGDRDASGRGWRDEHPAHRHRRAGHQRPGRATDLLGAVADAALVIEGGRVAWTGRAAEAPDADDARRRSAAARCSPASSTATATWSSPATGPRSSPPGWPGSRTPPAASAPRSPPPGPPPTSSSPATSPGWSRRCARRARRRVEIKSGYGLTVHDEARSLAVARQFTEETTFLGAHVVPDGHRRPTAYVALVTGPMLEAAAPYARWIDAFCETGAFDADQARAVLERGRGRRPAGTAARQPARPRPGGPAGRRARAWSRSTTAPTSSDADVDALARLRHHRDPAAGRGVLDPAAVPRRPPAARRRRAGGAGQRLQPGLVLHQLAAVLHRAGGARDGDDPGRGRPRRHRRRRRGPRPRRRRRLAAGRAGPTSCVLDAPSHVHLAYRPGRPAGRPDWVGGRPAAADVTVAERGLGARRP